ncbi:MAG: helix-turn-helix transcriptional regulator [Promicromonosporaceae bacterium]|nr:helix-turn-helix transcriptional regulator [Promicromonosporaceae bacterium]
MDHGWEFGEAVRRWRDRVTPEQAGLPSGGRRRAAGLRREELARLAGISVDYLTRLEQGRATSPSDQVVEALARALRLADTEREVLFRLAGLTPPGPGTVPTRLVPSVQRLLDRLDGTPVAVFDATWTLLTANAAYDALMGDTTTWQGNERNSVWRYLVGPGSRAVHTPQALADFEAGIVADLRLTAARYPADRRLRRLVADLTANSPRFERLWAAASLEPRETGRHKVVDHPVVGRVELDCDTLIIAGDDLRVMVYTAAPGTEDAEKLALATVVGTQALAGSPRA